MTSDLCTLLKAGIVFPVLPVAIAAFLQGVAHWANHWLAWSRPGIRDYELWRLVTGHLLHLGWAHWALNAVALVLVWFYFQQRFSTLQWWCALLLISVLVSLCLFVFAPAIQWYVGLSGSLHGLLVWAALGTLADKRSRVTASVLLVLVVVKILFEMFGDVRNFSESLVGGRVIVEAHAWGALAGVALWLSGDMIGRFRHVASGAR